MRTIMRGAVVTVAATIAIGTGGSAFAAAGGATGAANLQCFSGTTDNSGYGGSCVTTGKNHNGAVLTNDSGNSNGDYSGVYLNKKDLNGKSLSKISALGYSYTGTTVPGPGDLSLNFGVDTGGDGLTDAYAYVDAAYCPGTAGAVDVIHDTACGIWFMGTEYSNWAAFVAANPTASIAKDGQAFVVSERVGAEAPQQWTISNVVIGKLG